LYFKGFSRVRTGSMAANHVLGYAIIGLAIPAALALAAFIRAGAGWLHAAGPGVFLGFVLFVVVVGYAARVLPRSALAGPAPAYTTGATAMVALRWARPLTACGYCPPLPPCPWTRSSLPLVTFAPAHAG